MITITRTKHDVIDKKLAVNISRGIRAGFLDIGRDMQKKFRQKIIQGPKTGRIYKRRGRRHRASAPGEAPANETGNLQRTIKYDISGVDRVEVGYTAPYGVFLEEGTKNPDGTLRMAARPNIKPTGDENVAQVRVWFETNIRRAIL